MNWGALLKPMAKLVSFVDSGLLIIAARGTDPVMRAKAQAILLDTSREFASSPFVELEVMPKAVWTQNHQEVAMYEWYFKAVRHWALDYSLLIEMAKLEGAKFGLSAMDSLHVAAAMLVQADDLVTIEKPSKSIHRTQSIKVVSIH